MIKGKRMNIIICDDEKSTCGELERMLMEYARKNGICFNIEVFFTGDSLVDYLDKEVVQKFLNKWTIFLFCSILFSSNQKEH